MCDPCIINHVKLPPVPLNHPLKKSSDYSPKTSHSKRFKQRDTNVFTDSQVSNLNKVTHADDNTIFYDNFLSSILKEDGLDGRNSRKHSAKKSKKSTSKSKSSLDLKDKDHPTTNIIPYGQNLTISRKHKLIFKSDNIEEEEEKKATFNIGRNNDYSSDINQHDINKNEMIVNIKSTTVKGNKKNSQNILNNFDLSCIKEVSREEIRKMKKRVSACIVVNNKIIQQQVSNHNTNNNNDNEVINDYVNNNNKETILKQPNPKMEKNSNIIIMTQQYELNTSQKKKRSWFMCCLPFR